MPVVNVSRDELFKRIGENWGAQRNIPSEKADHAFDELCFAYGIELDDVTSEKMMEEKEKGAASATASDEIIYKVEVPANRYDLLSLEGLSRALRIFLGKEEVPIYKTVQPKQLLRMIVKNEVADVRPIVVCAVLRGLKFNDISYNSFIDLQEKLHQNICRRRTLVSIGTHDLDTLKAPFSYEALPPKEIVFAPLNNPKKMNGEELMNYLDGDNHLKKYLPIIRNKPRYPVIYDSNRVVLSLPPIINGDHSKITLNTKNVFIEVTATDATKADIVLNTLCALFSEYSSEKYSVEQVEVVQADGKTRITPDLSMREVDTSVDYINNGIGIDLDAQTMVKMLGRMSLPATHLSNRDIRVKVPCTRSDILHPCDIMEDVAIGFGYNNIKAALPQTITAGKQQAINKFSDLLRNEIAQAGYNEVLTLALCSREENFEFLNKKDDLSAVTIANPKTIEFEVARTSLLVGMLKTINHNKGSALPLKTFEISDVVLKDSSYDVGARNKRHLCAFYGGLTSGFESIHGLLNHVMAMLRVTWREKGKEVQGNYFYLKPSDDETFFEGRRVDIIFNEQKIGTMGIIHPQVLHHYKIPFPCSAFEIFLENFV